MDLEQHEQKYTSELNTALQQCHHLEGQAQDVDSVELQKAQLSLRPEKENSTVQKLREAYAGQAAHGSTLQNLLGAGSGAAVGVKEQRPVLIGNQEAGSDGIGADAAAREMGGQPLTLTTAVSCGRKAPASAVPAMASMTGHWVSNICWACWIQ